MQPHCNVFHICVSQQTAKLQLRRWITVSVRNCLVVIPLSGLNDQNKWLDFSKIVEWTHKVDKAFFPATKYHLNTRWWQLSHIIWSGWIMIGVKEEHNPILCGGSVQLIQGLCFMRSLQMTSLDFATILTTLYLQSLAFLCFGCVKGKKKRKGPTRPTKRKR